MPTVVNATNIDITWNISPSVSSQGISSFSIALIPQCVNGEPMGLTQRVSTHDETVTMASFGNLRELASYIILCLVTSSIANIRTTFYYYSTKVAMLYVIIT